MSNICIGLKKTCLGVLDRGECGKDIETGLKEGGVYKSKLQCSIRVPLLRLNTYLVFWKPVAKKR